MKNSMWTRLGLVCWFAGAFIPPQAGGAEIVKIGPEHSRLLPAGKEVDAIFGDYLLRSDRIAATVGGVASVRDANVNTQAVQGAVLDLVRLDLAGGNNDLLDAYYPHGHYLDAPGPIHAEILRAEGAEVAIRFTRAAVAGLQGDPVEVETEYRLRDGEPFLRIVTTYRNRGSKRANAAVYDKIRADTLFEIPPAGDTDSLIYDEPWHGAAYGVVRAGGNLIRSYANPAGKVYFLEGGNRLDFPDLLAKPDGTPPLGKSLPAPSPIPAGGEVVVERDLVPGRHPADVQAVIAERLGRKVAMIPVRVVDPAGKPVRAATVKAQRDKTVHSTGRTDADGRLNLILSDDPGEHDLTVTQRGRAETRLKINAPKAADRPVEIVVGPFSEAVFDVEAVTAGGRHRGPVKVVLFGVDGTPDPSLGPAALPTQAGNLCVSGDGVFSVPLAPGQYEAIIGRGPEFTRETRRFAVDYGKPATIRAEIHRGFDTPGWVIADLHNHTTASNDSIADTRGRVVGIAASGIEFAPATEHNRITSFASAIEAEHLGAFLQSAASIELSGRPGPGDINHQIAFPLRIREGAEGGGAPRTDRDPNVQMGRLFHLDDDAEKFVQQNHPSIGWLYFDKDQDGKPDGGFGTRPLTHAMELNRDIPKLLKDLEKSDPEAKRGTAFRWLQMLNQGDRIYGTANSDAHATAFHNGSIFTYIQSAVDDPARLDALALSRAVKAGRTVMSNGPFLEVSLDSVSPGGDVGGKTSSLLKIRVLCAAEIDVDRVQVLVNGRPDPALNWTRASGSLGFSTGPGAGSEPAQFERDVPLTLATDAHLIVIATGEHSRLGRYHGPYEAQPPTAVSNPIFVDVDGGGFTANRDTLGVPLPVSSRTKASSADKD
ncbi:hypothetical protein SAMN05444166_5127 [Singulisphaera sp. GP187]|uniref:CehA/McbA family metallohydrolase n=1 Tax=Singulisphaera sp. GP187 TaxID=1882752 RepID=UPI00092B76CD|nr:CehA/McbA family metallohydrolase [Singulisphaera sp. GP187]SIO55681.1 hypothetical protein SAMN05444166_5127 [Singulisphaera sp. GP187]